MNAISTRDRVVQRVESLTAVIPDPWDLEEFLRRLSESRGRPIVLRPFEAEGGSAPCGLYLGTASADHILYPVQVTPLQRDHIILHEISHLLYDSSASDEGGAGPRCRAVIDAEYARLVFPDIPLELVRRMLGRTGYSTEIERLAELFADEMRHLIASRHGASDSGDMTAEQRAIVDRLDAALLHPGDDGRG